MMESKSLAKELVLEPSLIYQLSLFRFVTKQEMVRLEGENKRIKAIFEITSQPNGDFEDLHAFVLIELENEEDAIDFSELLGSKDVESTFLRVKEATLLPLSPNKHYEFFAAWLKPGKDNLLQEFFVASEPIKQNYGRPAPQIKVQFGTVPIREGGLETFSPHISGLVEWNDESGVSELLGHPDFAKKVAPLFEQAILRMEMILGKII